MEKVLTIVVPAYNVEAYLERCLNSCAIPEIIDLFEVRVINDGSQDQTAQIAQGFCKRFPTSFFLHNKENGGHGSTINIGIRYAKGKYFKVLDGDDWLDSSELPAFINKLKELDTDLVVADYRSVCDRTFDTIEEVSCAECPELYGTTVDLTKTELRKTLPMHSLTIKTAILQDHDIRLDEHCFYVDCEYNTYPIPFIRTAYFHKGFVYQYRLGRNGQSVNTQSMQRNKDQHRHVLDSLLQFYSRLGPLPAPLRSYIERSIANVLEGEFHIYITMGLYRNSRTELAQIDQQMKNKFPAIWSATKRKHIALLRATNYWLLPLVWLIWLLKDTARRLF